MWEKDEFCGKDCCGEGHVCMTIKGEKVCCQTHSCGFLGGRYCNSADKQKGTCGPAWHGSCKKTPDDDIIGCAAYPADREPPNATLKYCICASPTDGWVNYEKGSSYHSAFPDYRKPLPSCTGSSPDNCK